MELLQKFVFNNEKSKNPAREKMLDPSEQAIFNSNEEDQTLKTPKKSKPAPKPPKGALTPEPTYSLFKPFFTNVDHKILAEELKIELKRYWLKHIYLLVKIKSKIFFKFFFNFSNFFS